MFTLFRETSLYWTLVLSRVVLGIYSTIKYEKTVTKRANVNSFRHPMRFLLFVCL